MNGGNLGAACRRMSRVAISPAPVNGVGRRASKGPLMGDVIRGMGWPIAPWFAIGLLIPCIQARSALAHPESGCLSEPKTEQSIVVSHGSIHSREGDSKQDSDSEQASMVLASDQPDSQELEPIAMASDYEKELAVPDLAEATIEPNNCQSAQTAAVVSTESEDANQVQTIADDERTQPQDAKTPSGPKIAPLSQPDEPVAGFNGIQPGVSFREEVLSKWGEPDFRQTDASKLRYQFDSRFDVEVTCDGVLVETVRITLAEATPARSLLKRLQLDEQRAAVLNSDRSGQTGPVAWVFPEHGIELHFQGTEEERLAGNEGAVGQEPGQMASRGIPTRGNGLMVREILIRPIRAEAFVLRAENDPYGAITQSIEDLQQAIHLEPKLAQAHILLSELFLRTGQAERAEKMAARAMQCDSDEDSCRLQWARCLMRLSRYDEAVKQTRQVLEGTTATPVVRAQALYQMGQLVSLGSKSVSQRAVALYQKAIDLADQHATSKERPVRQLASRVLLDAHLAIAIDIARGQWQKKDEYVLKWLARGSALAEEVVDNGKYGLRARLQVALAAITAMSRLDQPVNPKFWIREMEETVFRLREILDDKLALEQLDWEMGIAFFQAAEIEHRRGQPDGALYYGHQAEKKLTRIAVNRNELPYTNHLLGRLYFRLGAIYAVHQENHVKACLWYDRAAVLLLEQAPVSCLVLPDEHGDALVSMGVSYWQTDDRERALELTQAGAKLVEEAVVCGILSKDARTVPYGNLAAMYRVLGQKESAERYSKLADASKPSESSTKRR